MHTCFSFPSSPFSYNEMSGVRSGRLHTTCYRPEFDKTQVTKRLGLRSLGHNSDQRAATAAALNEFLCRRVRDLRPRSELDPAPNLNSPNPNSNLTCTLTPSHSHTLGSNFDPNPKFRAGCGLRLGLGVKAGVRLWFGLGEFGLGAGNRQTQTYGLLVYIASQLIL